MATTLPLCMSPIVGGPASVMVTNLLQAITTLHCALTTPSVWPEDYGPTAVAEGLANFDFVVVGGGTSGSVVASRLAENRNVRVLVLEAGVDPPTESEIPALYLDSLRGPQIEEYSTEPTSDACLGTVTGTCYWPIPRTLGGRSSVDHLMSFRGNKAKFDEWNLPNWSWNEVTRYYNMSERVQSNRGYLVVNEFDQYDNNCHISDIIFNGFRELGVNRLSPYVNSNSRVGIGFVKGHLKDGQRVGAGKSYLSVAKSWPNLKVIKSAVVTEIVTANGAASGVKFVYKGDEEMTVTVDKEVILAAGPIGNAKLLMLSGIGPEDELTELGIPTVVNLPGVGQNLQDQVGVPVPFQLYKSKASPKTDKERQTDTYYYLTDRYGPLSTIGLLAQIGFINSEVSCAFKNCPNPDLNLVHFFSQRKDVALKSLIDVYEYSDEISESLESANEEASLLLTFVSLQSPKSRGNLKLVSTNYLDKMEVNANYLQDSRDIESLLQGIKFLVKLEETKAYKKGKAEIIKLNIAACDDLTFKSDNYWRCYIRHMVSTMFAPSGTTKMGRDSDTEAVVDLRMKVRGVTGLRAVGSSIYVTAVKATNTGVMVGERLAEFLKQDHSL